MLHRIREVKKNQSGFTLIELLIVIVILGILAAIVVFAVSAFNKNGQQAACKADFKNVEIADEAYFAKNRAYATSRDQTRRRAARADLPQGSADQPELHDHEQRRPAPSARGARRGGHATISTDRVRLHRADLVTPVRWRAGHSVAASGRRCIADVKSGTRRAEMHAIQIETAPPTIDSMLRCSGTSAAPTCC